jgi:hypothetical protein
MEPPRPEIGCKRCARDNLEGQKSLGPLKISLEMAHKVISRIFKISGTLIVITFFGAVLSDFGFEVSEKC